MLSDKVVENERGKIIGTRVLPDEGRGPRMEITFQSSAKLLGADANNTGTVTSVLKSGGTFSEEGRGIVMTADGEAAFWTYQGVGRPTGSGMASSHRGSVFFDTQSAKLARLNGLCAIVEADFDQDGNMHAELWEWK